MRRPGHAFGALPLLRSTTTRALAVFLLPCPNRFASGAFLCWLRYADLPQSPIELKASVRLDRHKSAPGHSGRRPALNRRSIPGNRARRATSVRVGASFSFQWLGRQGMRPGRWTERCAVQAGRRFIAGTSTNRVSGPIRRRGARPGARGRPCGTACRRPGRAGRTSVAGPVPSRGLRQSWALASDSVSTASASGSPASAAGPGASAVSAAAVSVSAVRVGAAVAGSSR